MDNPDLIFDLAAGLLPENEARAAEAALSAGDRAELAAQRAVLAAIAEEPVPRMTDIERARLHRAVAARLTDAVRVLPAVPAAPHPSPRRTRSSLWFRVASAAGAAALFIGVVAVGSQLVGDGESDATADFDARSATTAALAAGGGDAATTTTAAAAFDMEGAQAESDGADAATLPLGDDGLLGLEEAPRLETLEAEADLLGLEDFAQRLLQTQRFAAPLSSLPCYEVAMEDDDLEVAASFRVAYPDEDGEERLAIAFSDAGTPTSAPLVRLYDPVTCEPLSDTTAAQ